MAQPPSRSSRRSEAHSSASSRYAGPGRWRYRTSAAAEPTGKPIYYQDPDGKPFYSLTPRKTPDGRDYRAVPAGADVSFDSEAPEAAVTDGQRHPSARSNTIGNPMGLPDTSPTPKKDLDGDGLYPRLRRRGHRRRVRQAVARQDSANGREIRTGRAATDQVD